MPISAVNTTELPLALLRNNCVSGTGEGSLAVQVHTVWRRNETPGSLWVLPSQTVGVACCISLQEETVPAVARGLERVTALLSLP